MNTKKLIPSLLAALLVAACGGGSSGSQPDGGERTVIAGTAAAGAPVIGTVTVKDSQGAIKTVNIEADGSYRIDVQGMSAPFVFRAIGSVGGTTVSLTSAATADDVGGTINITPFTDLIVANLAGKAAAAYFDAPDFSQLTQTEINAARQTLTERLRPVLQEMGVAAGFDLLRSAFKADRTQFDAVMDVVKVTVDSTTNQAVIRDLINNQQIVDDLASRSDVTPIAAPAPGSLTGAMTDLEQINSQLARLNALFRTGLPTAEDTTLRSLFVVNDDFMHGGRDLDRFLTDDYLLSPDVVGATFSNPVIVRRGADGQSMVVRFGLRLANGDTESLMMQFRKNGSGAWQMAGDRQWADLMVQSVNSRFFSGAQTYFSRNLELWVDGAANEVQRVLVNGPGLPLAGVTLVRPTAGTGEEFGIQGLPGGGSWLGECVSGMPAQPCVDFSQVRAGDSYRVNYYDANGARVGDEVSLLLEQPPVSNAEAQANADKWFPGFGPFSPASYRNLTDGTNINIGWTAPTDSAYRTSNIGLDDGQGHWFSTDVTPGTNTLLLGTWSGAAPEFAPNVWIGSEGPYNRRFVTSWHYPE